MEPFIGMIVMFGGNFAPRGWAMCDGQLLAISTHSALFSILGTTYGGDGRTTFALPDLRSRVAIHEGTGPGLSPYRLGQKGGVEAVQLNLNEMPSHTHTAHGLNANGNQANPGGNVWASNSEDALDFSNQTPNATLSAAAIGMEGGNQSHPNVQPYTVVNFIIALTGTYPSRS